MKNGIVAFFSCLLITVCSCSETSDYVQTDDWKVFYFDFDEVDHYYIPASAGEINFGQDSITPERGKLFNLYQNGYREPLKDTSCVYGFDSLGFLKAEIPLEKNDSINELFREKAHDPNLGHYMCMPVYRDILVFRKNRAVSGIALICFECEMIATFGTGANTREFGSFGTYGKLYRLLYCD